MVKSHSEFIIELLFCYYNRLPITKAENYPNKAGMTNPDAIFLKNSVLNIGIGRIMIVEGGAIWFSLSGDTVDAIVVHFSEEKLLGGLGQGGAVDIAESAQKFISMVEARLKERYPGANVRVVRGKDDRCTADGRPDTYLAEGIRELVEKVRQSQEWVVRR